jgi:hypothetical protein
MIVKYATNVWIVARSSKQIFFGLPAAVLLGVPSPGSAAPPWTDDHPERNRDEKTGHLLYQKDMVILSA